MTKGGTAGGQRDNMLQYRVKESGEVVIKVVVLRVVVGNQQCIPIFSQPFGNR